MGSNAKEAWGQQPIRKKMKNLKNITITISTTLGTV
jgi:hypothetical protein